jgi:hypothetical protein
MTRNSERNIKFSLARSIYKTKQKKYNNILSRSYALEIVSQQLISYYSKNKPGKIESLENKKQHNT